MNHDQVVEQPKLEIVLRPLQQTISDFEAWSEMLLDYDPDLENQLNEGWNRMYGECAYMSASCIVATVDSKPVGLVQYLFHDFTLMKGPVCYLSDLYVRPEYRRQGIARALVDKVLSIGREQGWTRVYWVTAQDNPARSLYDQYAAPEFVRYHVDLKAVL